MVFMVGLTNATTAQAGCNLGWRYDQQVVVTDKSRRIRKTSSLASRNESVFFGCFQRDTVEDAKEPLMTDQGDVKGDEVVGMSKAWLFIYFINITATAWKYAWCSWLAGSCQIDSFIQFQRGICEDGKKDASSSMTQLLNG